MNTDKPRQKRRPREPPHKGYLRCLAGFCVRKYHPFVQWVLKQSRSEQKKSADKVNPFIKRVVDHAASKATRRSAGDASASARKRRLVAELKAADLPSPEPVIKMTKLKKDMTTIERKTLEMGAVIFEPDASPPGLFDGPKNEIHSMHARVAVWVKNIEPILQRAVDIMTRERDERFGESMHAISLLNADEEGAAHEKSRLLGRIYAASGGRMPDKNMFAGIVVAWKRVRYAIATEEVYRTEYEMSVGDCGPFVKCIDAHLAKNTGKSRGADAARDDIENFAKAAVDVYDKRIAEVQECIDGLRQMDRLLKPVAGKEYNIHTHHIKWRND